VPPCDSLRKTSEGKGEFQAPRLSHHCDPQGYLPCTCRLLDSHLRSSFSTLSSSVCPRKYLAVRPPRFYPFGLLPSSGKRVGSRSSRVTLVCVGLATPWSGQSGWTRTFAGHLEASILRLGAGEAIDSMKGAKISRKLSRRGRVSVGIRWLVRFSYPRESSARQSQPNG
jgi:hypothetical protein